MIPENKHSRMAIYRDAGHIVFCHLFGFAFAHIGYQENTGQVRFEEFSEFIRQTLAGKPRAMRAQIQEKAALILIAGRIIACRTQHTSEFGIIAAKGTQRLPFSELQIFQLEYEDVIPWCRAVLWFQIPLSIGWTDLMEQSLIKAHIEYLAMQANALLLDANIRNTVEVVGDTLLRGQEDRDRRGLTLQIIAHLNKHFCKSSCINGCSEETYDEWNRACRGLDAMSG